MNALHAGRQTSGFNLIELLVIIGAVALLAVVLLPALATAKRKSARIGCVQNLKQIGVAFRSWEGDNGDKYPMQIVLANSETMRLVTNGNAYLLWQTMSNELSTPTILHCPNDKQTTNAVSFSQGFTDASFSYFFSLEATEMYPQMVLDGDDNLAVNGVRVKPGLLMPGRTARLPGQENGMGVWAISECPMAQRCKSRTPVLIPRLAASLWAFPPTRFHPAGSFRKA